MPNKIIRLKDLADVTGYSVSAVSKALKDSPEISDKAKKYIKKVAEELGFQPNSSARSLRLGKTFRIGIVLPSFANGYSDMLAGIEEVAKEYQYTTIVMNANNDLEAEREALATLVSMPVDGIISVPIDMKNYLLVHNPLVFLSRFPYREIPGVSMPEQSHNYVIADDYEGQRIAVNYLIRCCGQSHHVLFGSEDLNSVAGVKERIRLEGYRMELQSAGLEFDSARVHFGINTIEEGYRIAKELCSREERQFGICAANDHVAIGVMQGIQESNRRIPDDVSVIGYDDIELCPYLNPPLTTVHNSRRGIGNYAVRQVMDIIDTGNNQLVKTVLTPRLVVRSSCIAPK